MLCVERTAKNMKNLICMILIMLAATSNSMVVNENEQNEMPTAIESETVPQIIIEETEETEPEVQEKEIEVQEKAVVPKTETVETAKPAPAIETPAPEIAETQGQTVYVEGFGYVEVQAPTVTREITSDGDINKMVGIMD